MKAKLELRYLPAAILTLPILLLLFIIGNQLGWGRHLTLDIPKPQDRKASLPIAEVKPEYRLSPAEQAYQDLLQKPLFVPTRRPAPSLPTPEQKPVQTMQRGQFVLVGAIVTGETRIAMLRELSSGKIHRVRQGSEINGLMLESVEQTKAVLKQGSETEELLFKMLPPNTAATN